MKLYTEKEIIRTFGFGMNEMIFKGFMNAIKHIELPSDNKIKHEAITQMEQWYGSGCEDEIFAFINGAKYVINEIQGGNQ